MKSPDRTFVIGVFQKFETSDRTFGIDNLRKLRGLAEALSKGSRICVMRAAGPFSMLISFEVAGCGFTFSKGSLARRF